MQPSTRGKEAATMNPATALSATSLPAEWMRNLRTNTIVAPATPAARPNQPKETTVMGHNKRAALPTSHRLGNGIAMVSPARLGRTGFIDASAAEQCDGQGRHDSDHDSVQPGDLKEQNSEPERSMLELSFHLLTATAKGPPSAQPSHCYSVQ